MPDNSTIKTAGLNLCFSHQLEFRSFWKYKKGLCGNQCLLFVLSFVFVTYVEIENKLQLPCSPHKSE